jgi:hypothetical protein
MKAMGNVTHADAQRRIEECRALLESFERNEKCKQNMKEWEVNISKNPH